MIPKVFHQIWLGRSMPEPFISWSASWLKHNPEWKKKIWTEVNIPTSVQHLISRCKTYSQMSNVIRYAIIAKEGGVYIDTDFECLRPIESLIGNFEAFAGYQLDEPNLGHSINCAFFGASPNHPFVLNLLNGLDRLSLEKAEIELGAGPNYFTRIAKHHPEVHILPRRLLYPYLWNELHRRDEDFSDAFAVHHWAGMWFPDSRERR
jgi:mannosyltransferase OCH1-like enzyme